MSRTTDHGMVSRALKMLDQEGGRVVLDFDDVWNFMVQAVDLGRRDGVRPQQFHMIPFRPGVVTLAWYAVKDGDTEPMSDPASEAES